MNKSPDFFSQLETFEKQIKALSKDKKVNTEAIETLQDSKQQYILKGMEKAIYEEDYTLLVDDLAKFLDIDEKQVRFNIIPYVDYVIAPEGSAAFFSIEANKQMTFLEMRIKKWKRLFISEKSFKAFLTRHLVIYCPYTNIKWCEVQNQFISNGEGEKPIAYTEGMPLELTRKSRIAALVRSKKHSDLIRKTKNDITHARMLGLISAERLKEEMEYLACMRDTVDVPVHNQEIKAYIKKTTHYRLHLYKEESDKQKPHYSTKKKENDQVCIKPTVLYWFVEDKLD
ncbi:MAG: hypothetical protein ACRCW2_05370 [Cellulosilyticaceae bacterium]